MKDFFERSFRDSDPAWPVHDRILSMQSSALSQLMMASTLRRVYDNEFRIPAEEDAFTLPELLSSISDEIWSELNAKADKEFTAREPMISSLRRNLQREHMERLIDLTLVENATSAAYKAISNLCIMELRKLKKGIDEVIESSQDKLDAYTVAHLFEASQRIGKALEAGYIYNQASSASSGLPFIIFGEEAGTQDPNE